MTALCREGDIESILSPVCELLYVALRDTTVQCARVSALSAERLIALMIAVVQRNFLQLVTT